ncbi:hypothetical protein BDR03DRAFT_1019001 [Suillus americanus]|nr:hypothetical protein BDR03DRAFT_1019001 [Suillus americanus]
MVMVYGDICAGTLVTLMPRMWNHILKLSASQFPVRENSLAGHLVIELHTSQGVGRHRTRPVDQHLPPMPASALVPTPAPQPTVSVPEPAPAPPSEPASASDVPELFLTVELDKSTIDSIKCTAKEELHRVMMQERVAVLAMQKQRVAVIDKELKKA